MDARAANEPTDGRVARNLARQRPRPCRKQVRSGREDVETDEQEGMRDIQLTVSD